MNFRGGITEMMRQASRLQRKVEETKEHFKTRSFEVKGANDKVTVVVNGAREVVSIHVEPEFFAQEDRAFVFEAIAATTNAALTAATKALDAELEKVTGGVKIPGMT
jgi:DNA-binding YbaB/EbfC family protein